MLGGDRFVQVQAAVGGGLFEESHHLDLEKAPNSKGDNKELARDLSSFAVDGGTLIIGVRENKESRTFELAPQPLTGLPEKIEQVARTIPMWAPCWGRVWVRDRGRRCAGCGGSSRRPRGGPRRRSSSWMRVELWPGAASGR
ncbi:hypothetical protein [Streptomyces sp. NPDC087437]|uniref:hypothetical protein n=1 Tax=Streptomyces sp. NPDC087437 TaxID=3365789 RepID=UPI0037FCC306